jgi:hypothetical protein
MHFEHPINPNFTAESCERAFYSLLPTQATYLRTYKNIAKVRSIFKSTRHESK